MRRAAHIDENQPEIVQALLNAGCTVQSLAAVGLGCPDLLVGFHGVNLLMEVKNLERKRNGQDYDGKTLRAQKAWRERWKAPVHVVTSRQEALNVLASIIAAESATWSASGTASA